MRRQAELLMRKRMKKLRQKEQKMKENAVADERGAEGRGNAVEDTLFLTKKTSSPDTAADEIYTPEVADDDRWQMVPSSHPTLKSPRNGFGAFHPTPPSTKPAGMLRSGGYRDQKGALHFSGQKVWARKSKAPCEEEKESTHDNSIADEGCKVLIGSISVPLKDSPPSPPVGQRELFSSRVATAFLSQSKSQHPILKDRRFRRLMSHSTISRVERCLVIRARHPSFFRERDSAPGGPIRRRGGEVGDGLSSEEKLHA